MEENKMEEKNETKRSWVVPALLIVVVFQTIISIKTGFFSFLSRKQSSGTMKIEPFVPVPQVEEGKEASVKLTFVPSGISLKKNEVANIDLILTPKRDVRIDGVDIILNYDPKAIEITQVTTPKLFSFVSEKKEKEKEGKVYLTFLEEKSSGLLFKGGTKLVTLSLKGKSLGTSDLSIVTSTEGPTTVIAENGTSRRILFDRGSLKIVVY